MRDGTKTVPPSKWDDRRPEVHLSHDGEREHGLAGIFAVSDVLGSGRNPGKEFAMQIQMENRSVSHSVISFFGHALQMNGNCVCLSPHCCGQERCYLSLL